MSLTLADDLGWGVHRYPYNATYIQFEIVLGVALRQDYNNSITK